LNLRTLASLAVGLEALRANPLRSILSTLGVIIGVGALVSILALGDGLEDFSRSQIEQTTDLQSISVTPRTVDRERGIAVRRDSVVSFTAANLEDLEHTLGERGVATLTLMTSHWIRPLHDTTRFDLIRRGWPHPGRRVTLDLLKNLRRQTQGGQPCSSQESMLIQRILWSLLSATLVRL